jgi:hypothetical protein
MSVKSTVASTLLALAEERLEDAGELLAASAERASDNLTTTTYATLGLAALASVKNDVEQSVRLAAIADQLFDQLGHKQELYALEICGPAIQAARAQDSSGRLESAVEEARSLTPTQIANTLVTTS